MAARFALRPQVPCGRARNAMRPRRWAKRTGRSARGAARKVRGLNHGPAAAASCPRACAHRPRPRLTLSRRFLPWPTWQAWMVGWVAGWARPGAGCSASVRWLSWARGPSRGCWAPARTRCWTRTRASRACRRASATSRCAAPRRAARLCLGLQGRQICRRQPFLSRSIASCEARARGIRAGGARVPCPWRAASSERRHTRRCCWSTRGRCCGARDGAAWLEWRGRSRGGPCPRRPWIRPHGLVRSYAWAWAATTRHMSCPRVSRGCRRCPGRHCPGRRRATC
jgi:hypothetical protein